MIDIADSNPLPAVREISEDDRRYTTSNTQEETSAAGPTQKLLLAESRRVIDRQHAKIENIDEKAVRTVRLTLILLGASLSLIGYLNVERVNFVLLGGGGCLLGSIVFGVATYGTSNLYAGVTTTQLSEEHHTNPDVEDVRSDVLTILEYGIIENRYRLTGNATLLAVTRGAFVLGVVLLPFGFSLKMEAVTVPTLPF